jgi:hypothetical protein
MDNETREIISLCQQIWPDASVRELSSGPYTEPTMSGKEIQREDWSLVNLHDYLDRLESEGKE